MFGSKIPFLNSIDLYIKSDEALKYKALNQSIEQFNEFTTGFTFGRIIAVLAAYYLSGIGVASIAALSILIIIYLQKHSLKSIVKSNYWASKDVNKIEAGLLINIILRFTLIGIICLCFLQSKSIYANYAVTLLITAHCAIFIAQAASAPRIMFTGLGVLSLVLVATSIHISTIIGSLVPFIIGLCYAYIIGNVADLISMQYLKSADMHIELERHIQSVETNLKKIDQDAKHKEIMEFAAGVGTYKWNFVDNSHYWSRGTYLALGRDESKGIPTSDGFLNRLAKEDKERYIKVSREAKLSGKPFDIEFSSLGDDGKYRHIYFHGEILRDNFGNQTDMVGIVVDQTKLKETLENVTKTHNILHMALISSNSIVVEKDYTNNKLRAFGSLEGVKNPNSSIFERLSEKDLEAHLLQGLGDEGLEVINELVEQAEKEKRISTGLLKYRLQSGKTIDARINIYVEGEPSKNNGRMIIITTDISNEIARQKELLSSFIAESKTKRLLQLALMQGRNVVIVTDENGDNLESYGALELFDASQIQNSKDLCRIIIKSVPQDDAVKIKNTIAKVLETGISQTIEHGFNHMDGSFTNVRVNFSRLVLGKKTRIISISSDISEEIKRRNELQKTLEAANRASRAKSEFLANMSHEIRTPLNGVIAVAGLLSRSNLDDSQKEMVDLVENSGETLMSLLNDILDLARVESGKLEIEEIDFNINDALKSVVSLFSFKADEKGLIFNAQIDEALNAEFIGDPTRIKQIISNFLSNAIKFTKEGEVSLKASLSKSKNKNCCIIEVSDTGLGISKEDLAVLFERFEQVDGSITREHGGSGLGLAISKALAKLMGGDIKVTSKLGKGTKFTLKLYLEKSKSLGKFESQKENYYDDYNEDTGSLTILAADDNPTNRRILELVLSPLGVELVICENGQEAVDLYKSRVFDIVLMDLQMPVLDGLNAIMQIREFEKSEQKPHTPIIAISANAMAHQIEESINAGADSHIAKPYSPEGLIEGIELAIDKNTASILHTDAA